MMLFSDFLLHFDCLTPFDFHNIYHAGRIYEFVTKSLSHKKSLPDLILVYVYKYDTILSRFLRESHIYHVLDLKQQ